MPTPNEPLLIRASVETNVASENVARRLVDPIVSSSGGARPALALLFASAHFEDQFDQIAQSVHELLNPQSLVGATAEAVICNDRELEGQPGITLWALHSPSVRARSFHLFQSDLQQLRSPAAFREQVGVSENERPSFLLLADPFSINPIELLDLIERAYPGASAFGGMASAADSPRQNRIIFDGQCLVEGAVGVAIWGEVEIDTVVSQGCRPIARHYVVTRAERNMIHELGGKKAIAVLQEVLASCAPRDQKLLRQGGMFIGRAINESRESFSRGDFLIRNLLGLDDKSGAIAVNDFVRTGQTVQFHVRDAESAVEDMHALLESKVQAPATGALLFTCNGRGTRLFSQRNQDAGAIAARQGRIPVSGFFCAGEFGPIGARNFVHGHTASMAFFRPRSAAADPQ